MKLIKMKVVHSHEKSMVFLGNKVLQEDYSEIEKKWDIAKM